MDVDDLLSIPKIAWFNPTLLFVAGLLEGRGVRHEASNTNRAVARNWTVLRSLSSSSFGGHLSFTRICCSSFDRWKRWETWCVCWTSWSLFKCVTRTGIVIREESTSWSGSYLLCYIFIFRDLRCHFLCHTLITNRVWSVWVTVTKTRLVTVQYQIYFFCCKCAAILHRLQNKGKLVVILILRNMKRFGG